MPIVLARIDDRLIHGQIVVGWVKYTGANRIILANDEVAKDTLLCNLIEVIVPPEIKASVHAVGDAVQEVRSSDKKERIIVLFSCPGDALQFVQQGINLKSINLGGMKFSPGKRQILRWISISQEDVKYLEELHRMGIELEARAVPTDKKVKIEEYLKNGWDKM